MTAVAPIKQSSISITACVNFEWSSTTMIRVFPAMAAMHPPPPVISRLILYRVRASAVLQCPRGV